MPDQAITGSITGSSVQPGQLTLLDDLNAVRMFMHGSLLDPKSYILQRERGTFERPTFLIQSLNQAWLPGGQYAGSVDHNFLVEFYSDTYEEAMLVAGDLLLLFGSSPGGLVLPYYDFSVEPAEVMYDRWWEENAGFPPNSVKRMGLRVMPDTVVINSEQEQNEVAMLQQWTVSMTFRALAPRVLFDVNDPVQAGQVLREVKLTGFLTGSSAGFVSA
jgi:hypothetical protein